MAPQTGTVTISTDDHGNGWTELTIGAQPTFAIQAEVANPVTAGGYPVIPKIATSGKGKGTATTPRKEVLVVTEGPATSSVTVQYVYTL